MEQMYITFQEQKDNVPLGFAAAYNPTKVKVDERNHIQREWAYDRYELVDGVVIDRRTCYFDSENGQYRNDQNNLTKDVPRKLQPAILENLPQEGFKITDFVARERGNKLFKILDPRGFELEISVANLLGLMSACTISNCEFVGKYKWDFGKTGVGKAKLVKVE